MAQLAAGPAGPAGPASPAALSPAAAAAAAAALGLAEAGGEAADEELGGGAISAELSPSYRPLGGDGASGEAAGGGGAWGDAAQSKVDGDGGGGGDDGDGGGGGDDDEYVPFCAQLVDSDEADADEAAGSPGQQPRSRRRRATPTDALVAGSEPWQLVAETEAAAEAASGAGAGGAVLPAILMRACSGAGAAGVLLEDALRACRS